MVSFRIVAILRRVRRPDRLDPYGSAFIPKGYIEREWTRLFQLAAFHSAPDDWQDYSVLIPKQIL